MPGRGSYGPGGKWIYQRAKRLRAKNPEMEESTSFAIATQQAHKVGKSPKGFRTKGGVAEARSKYQLPRKEYRKTAGAEEMMAKMLKKLRAKEDTTKEDDRKIKYLRNQLYGDGSMKTAQLAGFFDELNKFAEELVGATPALPNNLLRQSQRVGKTTVRKPPDPNIRAVATKI